MTKEEREREIDVIRFIAATMALVVGVMFMTAERPDSITKAAFESAMNPDFIVQDVGGVN